MDVSKNFKLEEFNCKDGTPVPDSMKETIGQLAAELEKIRKNVGKPIIINSGYRTKEYNTKIGGSPNSQHLLGKAADIRVKGMGSLLLWRVIKRMMDDGLIKQGGLGYYETFVHYDIRGTEARWNG